MWTYGDNKHYEDKIYLASTTEVSLSDMKTHWRFVKDPNSTGKWQIINRATGSKIKVHDQNFQLALLPIYNWITDVNYHAHYNDFLSFEGLCSNENDLWFATYNNRGGVRPTGRMDGSARTTLQTKQTVFENTQTTYTSCAPSWAAGSCPSGYSAASGTKDCGVFNCCSKKKCMKHTEPHENQVGTWEWKVEPVTEYKRPDVKDAEVLQINSEPAEVLGGLESSLMTNGAWIAGAPLGLAGAIGAPVVCLVLDAIYFPTTEGPSVDEKLKDFGTDIMRITKDFTLRTTGTETLHGVLHDVRGLRRRFLVNYQREKSTDVKDAASANIMEMEALATELQEIGEQYRAAFAKLLPLSYDQVEDIDIERAKLSWDSMKMIAIELLAVYEERVALDAYISYSHQQQQESSDSKTCNTIIQKSVYVSELISSLKVNIMGTRDMLVNKAVEDMKSNRWHSKKNPATGDYFSWEYEDEIRWDMEHFSYRYDEVIKALDDFNDKTQDSCNTIITTSGLREKWRTFDPEWTSLSQDYGDSMFLLQDGAGGGSRCDNGKCLWDDSICQNFQGQCAIPIEDVKTKCGNWDECKGVVCRKDYVLNGVDVCLARSSIDPVAVIPGMVAIAKTP